MRKGADDDRDAQHRPRHKRKDSIPSFPARLPHLKSPDGAAAAAPTHGQSPAIISTHRFPASISRNISAKGKATMAAVHYYLGRPARVWISAHSPRSPARQARKGSGRVHSGIPGQPASGFTPFCARCGARLNRCLLAPRRPPEVLRDGGIRPSPDAAPAGGLLARRIANRPLRHRRVCRRGIGQRGRSSGGTMVRLLSALFAVTHAAAVSPHLQEMKFHRQADRSSSHGIGSHKYPTCSYVFGRVWRMSEMGDGDALPRSAG